jgi:hypothetical protein
MRHGHMLFGETNHLKLNFFLSVLIFWCCTNRVCVYKDQLKEFCSRIVNTHIYAYHFNKNLKSYSEHEDVSGETESFLPDYNSTPKPFPIKKDTT